MYRIRKGSLLDELIQAIPPLIVVTILVILAGLGNHFIDGLGV